MPSLFNKTKELVRKIDDFIDLTAQAGLHFKKAVQSYFEGKEDDFEQRFGIIRQTENLADILRKDVEAQLYVQTLIPESRGDVLGLLESMDSVIDQVKATTLEFSIERPVIPEAIKQDLVKLTDQVTLTVDALVSAVRAYFYNVYAVKEHLNKVKFYEKESDIIAEKIKRTIFAMNLDLSEKIHIATFIRHIDALADKSETVSDRLAIAAIKRIV